MKVEGALSAGGYATIMGITFPFFKREDAVNYAKRELGENFQDYSPRALQIINETWPEVAGKKGVKAPESGPPPKIEVYGAEYKYNNKTKQYELIK
jgi:hypothetical protein